MLSFTRLALTLSFSIFLSTTAFADNQPEHPIDSVYGGIALHNIAGNEESGIDGTLELRFSPVFGRGWDVEILPTLGAHVSFNGETNSAYLGATARYMLTQSIFVEGFLGFTLHDADTPIENDGANLGCSLLFREGLGIGYRHGQHALSLYGSHISHGGIICSDDNNDGLTTLGIRYGYHF